jgi:hypothetical protein
LAEQRTHKPRVGRSIRPTATKQRLLVPDTFYGLSAVNLAGHASLESLDLAFLDDYTATFQDTNMHPVLQQAYGAEIKAAVEQYHADALEQAFTHLERAHILGQSFSVAHARTHWWMLKVGWRRRDCVEISGQLFRILGALLFSRMWVPIGNTGGARVSPFQPMPIPEDLQTLLDKYGRGSNT